MRTVGVVTVARSDYGIYRPILRRIEETPDLRLHLIAAGMHLSPEFGMTVQEIGQDGFKVAGRVEMLVSSDTPEGIAKSMGLGTIGFAQAYSASRPDILLVLGDRFEMHAAAVAAVPFRIPVAHIHGGECTEGAIDELFRHSMTKMSHLHFVSTCLYAQRIVRMGEEPWRVIVCGAPSLDNLRAMGLLDRDQVEEQLGFEWGGATILATYHPVTLEYENTEMHIRELLAALEAIDLDVVFTYPNADTNSRTIIQMIREFTVRHKRSHLVVNLGTKVYFSLMNCVAAMVGNSSSGIIEAASFGLPVVNIGSRQQGRVRGNNVIDVGYGRKEILDGIVRAINPRFRANLEGLANPYGDGYAAGRIVQRLTEINIDGQLLKKRFFDAGNDNQ